MELRRRVECFDSIRFILSCMIYLNHCTFLKETGIGDRIFEGFLHNGRYAVTVFFILSGFCMYEGYGDRISNVKYIDFIKGRLRKFYALYMVSMLWVALFFITEGESVIQILKKVILSATLMQTITIKDWGILNSAAWFMSSLFVLYLLTPMLIKLANRTKKIIITIGISFFVIILYEIVIWRMQQFNMVSAHNRMLLTYVFPIYWLPVFYIGILMCRWKKERLEVNIDTTWIEIVTVLICIVSYLTGIHADGILMEFRSIYYCISAALFVLVFSLEQGWLSKCLATNKYLKLGGTLSTEIYLFHYPIIYYGGGQFLKMLGIINVWVRVCILFVMSLSCAVLTQKCQAIIRRRHG